MSVCVGPKLSCVKAKNYTDRVLAAGGAIENRHEISDNIETLISMELYDSASVIFLPFGYNQSTLYCLKPEDGSGDFDFYRTTVSTRLDYARRSIEEIPYNLYINIYNTTRIKSELEVGVTYSTFPVYRITSLNNISGNPNLRTMISFWEDYIVSGWIKSGNDNVTIQIDRNDSAWNQVTTTSNWQYFEFKYTTNLNYYPNNWGPFIDIAFYGANTSGKYLFVAGMQIVKASANKTALNTPTRLNFPRIEAYPSVKHPYLLMEPAATNYITYSNSLMTDWFIGSDLTRSRIQILGFDAAAITAIYVSGGINGSNNAIFRQPSSTTITTGWNTIAVLVKKTTSHSVLGLWYYISVGGGSYAICFNVDTLAITYPQSGGTNFTQRSASITQISDGVFLCVESFYSALTVSNYTMSFGPVNNNSQTASIGNSIAMALPQLTNTRYFPGFVISSNTATTKAAEYAKKANAALIGQDEGTVYVEFSVPGVNTQLAFSLIFSLNDTGINTNAHNIVYWHAGNSISYQCWKASSGIVQISIVPSVAANTFYKIAITYKNNEYKAYANGVLVSSNLVAGVPPTGLTTYGFVQGTATNIPQQKNRAVFLFPTALTEDQCKQLTA